MSTHTDTRQPTATDAGSRPGTTRRYGTAAWVAAVTVLLATAWTAAVLIPLSGEVAELPRSDIPGEVTVTVQETGERIVYYERETWLASVPTNPDLAIEVAGPDGQVVPVEVYEAPVHYRLPGLVGEAVATFEVAEPGEHTVAVHPAGEPLPDDARAAVGPSLAASVIGGLLAPVVLLVVGFLAAAIIAARAVARY